MPRLSAPIKSGSNSGVEKFQPLVLAGKSFPGGYPATAMHENELPELEHLVSSSMVRFARLPSDRIEREIAALLRQLLGACRSDRCGLMKLAQDRTTARAVHISLSDGIEAAPDVFVLNEMFPWTCENLLKGDIVCFSSLTELPPWAKVDRLNYELTGVHSSLAIPIYVGGAVQFFFFVHHVRARHIWNKEAISLLRLIGEVFVNSLGRCREIRERGVRPLFEQLISNLSVKFINVTAGEVDREIIAALEQVRMLFGFDRFGLVAFSHDKQELIVTHPTYGDGIGPVPEKVDFSLLFPWAKTQLLNGEMVSFSSLDDLPDEAAVDRKSWEALGVKATLGIPILVSGSVEYLIVASQVRSPQSIDSESVPRLRLLGEIFANAHVRCKVESVQLEAWGEIQRLKEKLQLETECLQSELICSQRHEEILGQSKVLARTLAMVEQVAPTDSTVLICGETGTGKELVAGAIQKLSPRRNKVMVKVNCASLPASLVESELFGREKGAYTGALTRQAGRFEMADGGTIFLDEIAEMSLELQAKLLRVLQEGQFERLGSTKTIQVDVRVIAATNRNLAEEVKKGKFREDLYYRLNVFQIVVPPLRERLEDIPLLVWAFVDEFGEKMGKKINKVSKQDMAALQRFNWPGNVRELRNVVEHAVIVSSGDRLQVRLPEGDQEQTSGIVTLEDCQTRHILETLRLTGWRIKGEGGAAQLLGLNPSTLYSRMQKLGINNRQAKDEMSP